MYIDSDSIKVLSLSASCVWPVGRSSVLNTAVSFFCFSRWCFSGVTVQSYACSIFLDSSLLAVQSFQNRHMSVLSNRAVLDNLCACALLACCIISYQEWSISYYSRLSWWWRSSLRTGEHHVWCLLAVTQFWHEFFIHSGGCALLLFCFQLEYGILCQVHVALESRVESWRDFSLQCTQRFMTYWGCESTCTGVDCGSSCSFLLLSFSC